MAKKMKRLSKIGDLNLRAITINSDRSAKSFGLSVSEAQGFEGHKRRSASSRSSNRGNRVFREEAAYISR